MRTALKIVQFCFSVFVRKKLLLTSNKSYGHIPESGVQIVLNQPLIKKIVITSQFSNIIPSSNILNVIQVTDIKLDISVSNEQLKNYKVLNLQLLVYLSYLGRTKLVYVPPELPRLQLTSMYALLQPHKIHFIIVVQNLVLLIQVTSSTCIISYFNQLINQLCYLKNL